MLRTASALSLLAVVLATLALRYNGVCLLLLWPVASLLVVAAGYFGAGEVVYGKRADGTLPLSRRVILWPWLTLVWFFWDHWRRYSPEPAAHQLQPDIWIGRRLLPQEVPPEIQRIVDLTAEFDEPPTIRKQFEYICLPVLDAGWPTAADLTSLLDRLESTTGNTYIHCAAGHGRTALVAAAWLLRRRVASSPEAALQVVRSIRMAVQLNRGQREFLCHWAQSIHSTSARS